MTIAQATKQLHKLVRLVNPRLYIDSEFILSEIKLMKNDKGIKCYRCTLTDTKVQHSTLVCRLEELRMIET